jgi:hypothetical protein
MRDLSIVDYVRNHIATNSDNSDPGVELVDIVPLVEQYLRITDPTCQDVIAMEHLAETVVDHLYTEYPSPILNPKRERLVMKLGADCSKLRSHARHLGNTPGIVSVAWEVALSEHHRIFSQHAAHTDQVLFVAHRPELQDVFRMLDWATNTKLETSTGDVVHLAPRWLHQLLASEHSGPSNNSTEYSAAFAFSDTELALSLIASEFFYDLDLENVHRALEALV